MKTLTILLLIFASTLVNAKQKTLFVKSRYGGWVTEVSIVIPKNASIVKGLVILIPGSESVGEPAVDDILGQNPKLISQMSAMGQAILDDGFAYASFNTRGVYPLHTCMDERDEKKRIDAFIKKCINPRIRTHLNWNNIELDILGIYMALKSQKEFKNIKTVALARSEGGMHISRLIRLKKIRPDALVGIGVPTESPFENTRLQSTLSIYLARIVDDIENSSADEFTIKRFKEIFPSALPAHEAVLLQLIGKEGLNKEKLEHFREAAYKDFNQYIDKVFTVKRSTPVDGNVMGKRVAIFGSAGWWADALSDKIDLATSIKDYPGNRIFLFGEYDYLVAYNRKTACGALEDTSNCKLHIIPKVGHSLEDSTGRTLSKATASVIVQALNEAIQ
jgi:hypothetical protein